VKFKPDPKLNNIVSLWQGDITELEIDAIVNAAKASLMGGGGIDGDGFNVGADTGSGNFG